MNTIEGNKIIAEFMEWVHPFEKHTDLRKIHRTQLQYHSSWDWLMPVVEKIESLDFIVEISLVTCSITEIGELFEPLPTFYMEYSGLNKIDSVWNIVTQFIEWFKRTKRKRE